MKYNLFSALSAAFIVLASTSVTPASAATNSAYTVKPGDTFYKISVAHGTSLAALERANPQLHDFVNIYPGEHIYIPATRATTSTASKQQAVLTTAKSLLGIPYGWGSNVPSKGLDCSGFVQYVFSRNGITLPRQSHDQATMGTPIAKSNLQPGDLLFFSNTDQYANLFANHVTHVGIYMGNGAMIESSSTNNNEGVVVIQNVFGSHFYSSHYYGARRVIR